MVFRRRVNAAKTAPPDPEPDGFVDQVASMTVHELFDAVRDGTLDGQKVAEAEAQGRARKTILNLGNL